MKTPSQLLMDRLLLILSTLAFAGGVVHAVVALRAGRWKESRWQWVPMAGGFVLQTAFLSIRGQMHGRCPVTNLLEVFVFIAWSIVLLYFLVGSTYRLSLLGVFTAPLVAVVQTLALILPLDRADDGVSRPTSVNPMLELHAGISLIAYAAFALACITGVMYLLQERLLKRHRIGGLFYQLPPINGLAKVIRRLTLLGLVLLTIGLAISLAIGLSASQPKMVFGYSVWVLYAVMNLLMWRHVLSPRQTAWLAVTGFAVPFFSLWLVARV